MILSGLCVAAKKDFITGLHQPGDKYMIALYRSDASLNTLIDEYTSSGEVAGQGYISGGRQLRGYRCEVDGTSALLSWDSAVWPNATIHAKGALIYNASKRNRALAVIEFLQETVSTNGNFVVPMPPFTSATALVRIM